jgi:hypothetical protein
LNDASVHIPGSCQHAHPPNDFDDAGDDDIFTPGKKAGRHQEQDQQQLPIDFPEKGTMVFGYKF